MFLKSKGGRGREPDPADTRRSLPSAKGLSRITLFFIQNRL